jgi:hypothetical protein
MMELLGLLSCAFVFLQDQKLMYDRCISLFTSLSYQQMFRSARHFIIFGETELPTADDSTVYALLLKPGC